MCLWSAASCRTLICSINTVLYLLSNKNYVEVTLRDTQTRESMNTVSEYRYSVFKLLHCSLLNSVWSYISAPYVLLKYITKIEQVRSCVLASALNLSCFLKQSKPSNQPFIQDYTVFLTLLWGWCSSCEGYSRRRCNPSFSSLGWPCLLPMSLGCYSFLRVIGEDDGLISILPS